MSAISDNESELAHWLYKPEEWEQLIDNEWASRRAQTRRSNMMFVLFFLAAIVFVSGVAFVSGGWLAGIIVLIVLGGFVLAGFALLSALAYDTVKSWYEQVRTVRPEVLITSGAVIYGGPEYGRTDKHRPLVGFGRSLRVTIVPGAQLVLCFDMIEHLHSGHRTRIRLPIPTGHENEANRVVDYFRWESRVARKASSTKG